VDAVAFAFGPWHGSTMLPLIAAIGILTWARMTRKPWSALGLGRPANWLSTIALGIAFGIAFKFCMKAIVMPLLGADPVNQSYHWLAGNTAALPGFIATIVFSAGFAEEVVFRGFLFHGLGKRLGTGRWATVATVVISAVVFGLGHWQGQKLPGVQQAVVVGLVFGTIFARTRNLWMLMIAHAAFDLTALWMIYYGLESRIAHLVFK
jgi:membrane protease YdiL (CAAX protease family)